MRILDSSPLGKVIFKVAYSFMKTDKHLDMRFPVDPVGNMSSEVWISTYDFEDYRTLNITVTATRFNMSPMQFKLCQHLTKSDAKRLDKSFEAELKQIIINLHIRLRKSYEQAKGELMDCRSND